MARLTKSQRIILEAARDYDGLVMFGAGDRRGTRISGITRETGIPIITAYSNPEYFLKSRGLLKPAGGNFTRFVYRITEEGLAAIPAKKEQP